MERIREIRGEKEKKQLKAGNKRKESKEKTKGNIAGEGKGRMLLKCCTCISEHS